MQELHARPSLNGCPSMRRRMPVEPQTDAYLSKTFRLRITQNTKDCQICQICRICPGSILKEKFCKGRSKYRINNYISINYHTNQKNKIKFKVIKQSTYTDIVYGLIIIYQCETWMAWLYNIIVVP